MPNGAGRGVLDPAFAEDDGLWEATTKPTESCPDGALAKSGADSQRCRIAPSGRATRRRLHPGYDSLAATSRCRTRSAVAPAAAPRTPTTVATILIRVRLLRRLPRIWLASHCSTAISTPFAWAGAQLSIAVSGDSATVRGGTGRPEADAAWCTTALASKSSNTPVVAALGGGIVDLEQRFGFGAADRLMLDGGRGQDARAPGGVIGIQRAGKMNTALGGGALAGDHAIAHDGKGKGSGIAAGNPGRFEGADTVGKHSGRGRHRYTSHFLVLVQHFHAGVNEWLTIQNRVASFLDSCQLVAVTSVMVRGIATGPRRDGRDKRQYRGSPACGGHGGPFAARARIARRCYGFPLAEKDLPFCRAPVHLRPAARYSGEGRIHLQLE